MFFVHEAPADRRRQAAIPVESGNKLRMVT
jgi:hypothetical protein